MRLSFRDIPFAAQTPILADLQHYWTCNDGPGLTLNDSTLNRGVLQTSTSGGGVIEGRVGNARKFHRADSDQATLTTRPTLVMTNTSFTMLGWFQFFEFNQPGAMMNKDNGTNSREYALYWEPSSIRFLTSTTGANFDILDSGFQPTLFSWFFAVCWYDNIAKTMNIQINNGTVVSKSHLGGVFNGTAPFTVNLGPGGRLVCGYNQMGIWKRVLTAAERSFLYNINLGKGYPLR